MNIEETIKEFEAVYSKCAEIASKSGFEPEIGDLLSMAHMVFSRKDAEFERKMATEMAEAQKMEAVYGRGYSSEDYDAGEG